MLINNLIENINKIECRITLPSGENIIRPINWGILLKWFNLDLPLSYVYSLKYLKFLPYNKKLKTRLPCYPCFTRPIYHKEKKDFRLIPGTSGYFVNKNGLIYLENKDKSRFLPIYPQINRYPIVDVSMGVMKRSLLHRLVALTWLPLDNYMERYIVDHIDCNRLNYHVDNLRWCSYRENSKYAVIQNAITSRKILTYDIHTKEEILHNSMTDACAYMGRSRFWNSMSPLRYGKIWRCGERVFEVKEYGDKRPWLYQNDDLVRLVSTYYKEYVDITYNKQTIRYYSRLEAFLDVTKQLPIPYDTEESLISTIKMFKPGIIVRVYKIIGYEAKNDNGDYYKSFTVKELSDLINVPKSTIIKYAELKRMINGWKIRRLTYPSLPWGKYETNIPINYPKAIRCVNITNGVEIKVSSLREAERKTGVSRKTITQALDNDKICLNIKTNENWEFKQKS